MSKAIGWKELVHRARLADVKQYRANMRADAMRFREEIAPDYCTVRKFSERVAGALRNLEGAIFYRNLASQVQASVENWLKEDAL